MPGLTGHIVSHPAWHLNKDFLWNLKQCAVAEIALISDKSGCGQHYSERHCQQSRVKIAHCLWFCAAYLCFRTHIQSLINLSQIRPFGLQVSRGVVTGFWRLLNKLKYADCLICIHVNNQDIADELIAASYVEFHSYFYAVR